MEFILASKNRHKAAEFSRILTGHEVLLPKDLGINFDHEETGTTFLENSFAKAESLYKILKRPVISDDSGLCVPALNGEPGLFSSRYGMAHFGRKPSSAEQIEYLLSKLENISDRKAFFVCAMTIYIDQYHFTIVQDTMDGIISKSPSGIGGFGYDPIFYIPELKKTAAELGDFEKDKISHRGKAGKKILSLLS
ncbi:MAG: RdgB/HAM1 family non-canonical purine NTP pyrophosphatase [Spirochaetales bacterium]|nr:RdgB/HAM1 family non-canonical purine NTP pyrophosphatase [Spirochaetales bacterium]